MGYKFNLGSKKYQFPSVQDLVAASAVLHRRYENGEEIEVPYVHKVNDAYSGEELAAIQVDRYVAGVFHIWMVAGYVVYTRTMFDTEEKKVA